MATGRAAVDERDFQREPLYPNPNTGATQLALSAVPTGQQLQQPPASQLSPQLSQPPLSRSAPAAAFTGEGIFPAAATVPAASFPAGPPSQPAALLRGAPPQPFSHGTGTGRVVAAGRPDLEDGSTGRSTATGGSKPMEGFLKDFKDAMSLFPTIFSLFCVSIFIMPIWMTCHLGLDINVQHWISRNIDLVGLLGGVFLGVHFVHLFLGRPSKLGMIVALVGSSICLIAVSNWLMLESGRLGSAFASSDCTTFEGKRQLETEFVQAQLFYRNCLDSASRNLSMPAANATRQFRIQDCPDYSEHVEQYPGWTYLGALEEQYHCSGWCSYGPPMWTARPTQDACSVAVADILLNKVRVAASQVVLYDVFTLVVSVISLFQVVPLIKHYSGGYDW